MSIQSALHGIFVANVNARLAELRLTRADLAAELAVTPSYVSQVLTGYRSVALVGLERWAKALGLAPDMLIRPGAVQAPKALERVRKGA